MSVSSEKGAMILQGVFSILLFGALFLMGMNIDLRVVKSVLRKPIGPAIGFFSQFVFMPLASYGIAMGLLKQGDNNLPLFLVVIYELGFSLISITDFEKLGLILLGSCPGGAASNFWTAMLDGDVNLSVTMTLVSSVASFGMTSLWIYLLGDPLVSAR